MDPTNQKVTDDQELAKVLESMNQQSGTGAPVATSTTDEPVTTSDGLSFEQTVATEPSADTAPAEPAPATSKSGSVSGPAVVEPLTSNEPVIAPFVDDENPVASSDLDTLKKDALEELRPLVDKLDLPADEKFDTLLLLIRSTDDKSLLEAAHNAAKEISNETKRAQALLDVIKEIDYFSGHGKAAA